MNRALGILGGLWLGFALCQVASAVEPQGSLAVQISTTPDKLILDKPTSASVRVSIRQNGPGPMNEKPEVHLQVNVGQLRNLQWTGPQELSAEYVPPPTAFPQLAILVAVAKNETGSGFGWKVLPLWGVGDAAVLAKPNSLVKVRIQDATFGPVRTDSKGSASVPVIVPPGVYTAVSQGREIALNLPPINRIAVVAGSEKAPADGTAEVLIFGVAVTPSGEPAPQESLEAWVNRGTITQPASGSDGTFVARYKTPRETGESEARINVRIAFDPSSEGTASVLLSAWSPPAAKNERERPPRPPSFFVGADLGYWSNLQKLDAPVLLTRLGWILPFLERRLAASLEVGYLFSNRRGQRDGQSLSSALSVLPIALSMGYRHCWSARTSGRVDLGLGLFATWHQIKVRDQASVQGYATNWGPHGSVSGELKLGPGSGLLTLRYAHVPESGIAELSGNIGGLAILLGYELWL